MEKNEYIENLEFVIKQMLKPLKQIPFNLVIEAISNEKVIKFDPYNLEHKKALNLLKKVAFKAGKEINNDGILRRRANEVGNDIEKFVKSAFDFYSIKSENPKAKNGTKKSAGYPDLVFYFENKPYYLECKTYNLNELNSSLRSFYLSPSSNFKIIHSTIHFLLSFQIYLFDKFENKNIYKCKSFKILSLENLHLDVKYEFNSNNKRLYSCQDGTKLLYEGEIK